jgi:hypothetical protein
MLAGELLHGLSHGTTFQEPLIKVLAYSSAPTGLASFTLILWGLRITNDWGGDMFNSAQVDKEREPLSETFGTLVGTSQAIVAIR